MKLIVVILYSLLTVVRSTYPHIRGHSKQDQFDIRTLKNDSKSNKNDSKSNKNDSKSNKNDSKSNKTLSTKSAKHSKTPKAQKQFPECTGDDLLSCKKNDYYVCIFDQNSQSYQTFCTSDKEVKNHLLNAFDYCGKCSIELEFKHKSVVNSFEDTSGSEIVPSTSGEPFLVEYEAKFNEFDFVSLAASQNLILDVDCIKTNDVEASITIRFKKDINPDLTPKMFPQGSLLAVDGSLFGSCNTNDSEENQGPQDGFLLIDQASSSGQIVTTTGSVATVNHFFDTFSVKYSLDQRRRLLKWESTEVPSKSWKYPEDGPIFLQTEVKATSKSFIEFAEMEWSIWSGTYNLQIDFGWFLQASLSTNVTIEAEEKVELFDKTFLEDWRYPLYGLPLPKLLQKVLKFFLPASHDGDVAVGLYLGSPINLKLDLSQKVEITVAGIDITMSTGEKVARFTASSGAGADFTMAKDEPPSATIDFPSLDDRLDELLRNPVKMSGFAGVLPQLVFKGLGFATVKLGISAGIFFETNTNITHHFDPVIEAPGLPYELGCDSCHHMEAEFSAGIAEPFLKYKAGLSKEDDEEIPLPDFELKFPLIQICLDSFTCPVTTPVIVIKVFDPDLINDGGTINTIYSFEVEAKNIPDDIGEVLLEWTPGYGSGGSLASQVDDGKTQKTIEISFPIPGSFSITVVMSHDGAQLADASIDIKIIGTTLTIVAPTNVVAGVEETYIFQAKDLPASTQNVEFDWSFGVGSSGTGSSPTVTVTDETSSASVNFTYEREGGYGLVVDVRDASTNDILAEKSTVITIGTPEVRNKTYEICDTWSALQNGAQGVTMDVWNISMIPTGAIFDLVYEMYDIPDRLFVEYPAGNMVLDTGWRGKQSYSGSMFPGGIISPGDDQELDIFTRFTYSESFRVTIVGPYPGTEWKYQVRCRAPGNNIQSSLFEDFGPQWYEIQNTEPSHDPKA